MGAFIQMATMIVYDTTSACLELFTTISISQIEFSYCA
jgi:hypothetical protein